MSRYVDPDDEGVEDQHPSAAYQSSFSCLVAEISKKPSHTAPHTSASATNSLSRQRRAKVTVEVPVRQSLRRVGGAPALGAAAAAASFASVLFSIRVEYPVAAGSSGDSNLSRAHQLQPSVAVFDFLPHSTLKWVVPESAQADDGEQDESVSATSLGMSRSAAVFDHDEYSVKLSNVAKRAVGGAAPAAAGLGGSGVEIVSSLITFERFLEARVFARQLHWILQVVCPTRLVSATVDPSLSSAVAAGAPNSCALVALPIRWWFRAWSDLSPQKQQQHQQQQQQEQSTDDPNVPAFVLTTSGVAETTWHVRGTHDAESASAAALVSAAASDALALGGVHRVLPLLESPAPTPQSEISVSSALQWAACQSVAVLSTAMEGATLFRKREMATATTTTTNAQQMFDPVLVCTGSLNNSSRSTSGFGTASGTASSAACFPAVSSRTIASLASVQPVLLEHSAFQHQQYLHVPHRVVLAGKNGGLDVVQLTKKKVAAPPASATTISSSETVATAAAIELKWNLVSQRRLTSESLPFVAMPLQDAVLEASSSHASSNVAGGVTASGGGSNSEFVIGSSTNAIVAVCRVLCVAVTGEASPRPVVFDPAKKTMLVLAHHHHQPSENMDSSGNTPDSVSWAKTLVRACLNDKLLPVTLLPLRPHPAFVAPPPPSAASLFGYSYSVADSSPTTTSLESLLLLSAMREVANSARAAANSKKEIGVFSGLPIQTAAPLHKLRPNHRVVSICVAGSVGIDVPELICALSAPTLHDGSAAASGSASHSSVSSSLMSDWLIFGCRCHSCRAHAHVADSQQQQQQQQRPQRQHHRLIRAQLVEAPPNSPHAMAAAIAASDIVLLVVDCISPHSLSWLADEGRGSGGAAASGGGAAGVGASAGSALRQVLLERRAQTLSFDKNAVQIGGPTAIIVTLNSGSYRRTVTQEQVAAAADRLKCLEVAELDFGSDDPSGAATGQRHANSSTNNNISNNNNRCFSRGDCRVVTGTVGRCVQACAAYGRLIDHGGFLPVQAEWIVACLSSTWSRLFAMAAQLQDEDEAALGDTEREQLQHYDVLSTGFGCPGSSSRVTASASQPHSWLSREFFLQQQQHGRNNNSNNKKGAAAAGAGVGADDDDAATSLAHRSPLSATASSSLLRDATSAAGFVDETFCEWIESDMNLINSCRYSIADVACFLANACSARDMRGQLLKMLVLKRAVSLAHSSSISIPLSSTAAKATPSSSSSLPSSLSLQTLGRSRKMAKKLFLLVTTTSAVSPTCTPRASPVASARSTGRAGGTTATARESIGAGDAEEDDDDRHNVGAIAASLTPRAGEEGTASQRNTSKINSLSGTSSAAATTTTATAAGAAAGVSPAALFFLLSAFGIAVAQEWIDALWAETARLRLNSETLSLNTWLRLLHLHEDPEEEGRNPQQRRRLQQQQSVFTTSQFSVADFGLVTLRWMVEVSKSASTQMLTSMREGWVASGAEMRNAMMTMRTSSATTRAKTPLSSSSFLLSASIQTPTAADAAGAAASRSPTSAQGGKIAASMMTAACRSCKKMRPDSELLRCIVCERHCCIPLPASSQSHSNNGSKQDKNNPCCISVGRREADQQRNALVALVKAQNRNSSGNDDHHHQRHDEQQQLRAVLKKLPHVCRVCLLSHTPFPWQPDSEATSCFCCGTKYSVMFRRHHCRDINCGRVVCGNCSKFEAAVFGYPSAQRICLQCYNRESPFVPLGGNQQRRSSSAGALMPPITSAGENGDDENDDGDLGVAPPPATDDHEEDDNDDLDDSDEHALSSCSSSSLGNDDDDGRLNTNDNNQRRRRKHRRRSNRGKESAIDEDDDTGDTESFLGSLSNTGSGLDSSDTTTDPRVVFAPWAHLVLNGEPDTVIRQPWYETMDEAIVEDALSRVREMAREAVRAKRHVPRAEYVVRQPGLLLEADAALEEEEAAAASTAALSGVEGGLIVTEEFEGEFSPDE